MRNLNQRVDRLETQPANPEQKLTLAECLRKVDCEAEGIPFVRDAIKPMSDFKRISLAGVIKSV